MSLITYLALLAALVGCTVRPQPEANSPIPERPPLDTIDPSDPVVDEFAWVRSENCEAIDLEAVSSLVPDDWDAWCRGSYRTVDILLTFTDSEVVDLCDGFWAAPDQDILGDAMRTYDISRDEAIGMIDTLWTVC